MKTRATPFIDNVSATYSGDALESISFLILPKAGSFTRPLTASITSQYLAATGSLQTSTNPVTIPVYIAVAVLGLICGFIRASVVARFGQTKKRYWIEGFISITGVGLILLYQALTDSWHYLFGVYIFRIWATQWILKKHSSR